MTIRKISSDAIDSGSITENLLHVAVSNKINSAYATANTATTTGSGGYDQANTARNQANAAYGQANNAYSSANLAYAQANSARSDANTTFATVNTTFGTVNTNYQAAYAQANTARGTANDAYAAANTKLSTSGGSISGDLAITGNLTVTGNATTINVTNLSVNDSMILLSTNAVGDSNDIGFIGHFDRGATATHAGLIRKATENRFYLFDNYEVEPTNNVIDVAGNNFRVGNLRLGIINANSYVTSAGLDVTGQANAAYAQANTAGTNALNAYGQANTARNTANSAYGQANTATTNAGNAYDTANSAFTASSRLRTDDTRTIAPNTHTAGRLTFGFTSYTNNGNASTYADYLHFRSYTDSSGGSDNLVMFHKSGIGMRIWQQTWNSSTAYSNYVDVLHSSNYSSYALPLTGGTISGNVVMGSSSNQFIRYRTASTWDYYLSAVNDDFSIYDSQSTVFLKTFYNGGGTGKYISFLGNLNVKNDGNVGIGTTSPAYLLDVQGGTARFGSNTYNSNILFGNEQGSWGSGIRVYDNNDAELRIWHLNGRGQIILATGYNGNGSTSLPSDGLFIVGDPTASPSLKVGVGYTAANLRGGAAKFAVNGNVGIGISNPTIRLQVQGTGATLFSSSLYHVVTNSGTAGQGMLLGYHTGSGVGGLIAGDAVGGSENNLIVGGYTGSAWQEVMRVKGTANVMIGHSSVTCMRTGSISAAGAVMSSAGRYIVGWYSVAPQSSTTYTHLKTSLWGGGSPNGNIDYWMGGFEITGYVYSTNANIKQIIQFHNWSGTVNNYYQKTSYGSYDPDNIAYVGSDGYVYIRLVAGQYLGYRIDVNQYEMYVVRDIRVTSVTNSNSATL